MAGSLQDQLLKAGLVDKKKANKIQKQKHHEQKQAQKHNAQVVDEAKVNAEKARKEQQERDRELNRQRQEQVKQKELIAQAIQIIKHSQLPKTEDADVSYSFVQDSKVKKIFVTSEQVEHLSRGLLAIVALEDSFAVVPALAAQKIQDRVPDWFVAVAEKEEIDEDDPYKDFQIPDDLMW